jgi:hypothetical protein
MRKTIVCLIAVRLLVCGCALAAGDDEKNSRPTEKTGSSASNTKSESEKTAVPPALESELKELRQLVQEQNDRLRGLQQRLSDVEGQVAAAKAASGTPAGTATPRVQPTDPAESAKSNSNTTGPPATPSLALSDSEESSSAHLPPATANQGTQEAKEKTSPLYFQIGNARFTPGGFVDLTEITRSTNLGSGIATSFGALPFNNTTQGRLTETHFSAQYSRLSLKVDAPATNETNLTGYVEADFLGFQPANAFITSNSNSLRMRVYWAQVEHGKWDVLAGQEWSLLTPNRVGISPFTPDIFYTLDEDPNFQVGLTWTRQAQFRVTYHPTEAWAIAISAENPQQIAPASVVFPSPSFVSQFDNASSATNAASATTNTAVPNLVPDVIAKTAYDGKLRDHPFHIEVAGIARSFRVLNTLATPNRKDTITGGGGSINVFIPVVKNLTLIGTSFYSCGGARYFSGLGPDVIVKPNGGLSCVHSGSGIGGFEWAESPRYTFYGYYGGAYFFRNFGRLPSPGSTCAGVVGFSCVGFGFPGSSDTSNRAIQEATFGVIPTLWSSETYGKFQIITQYSYLKRSPWSVAPTDPKNAHLSMVYAGFRYTLP